jgi:acylphosphatase
MIGRYVFMTRYSIIVDGRVQGVGFRYFTQLIASELNLTGWCKNLADGRVEIEVQGPEEIIDSFIARIRKGNNFCRVNDMSLNKIAPLDNEKKFKVTY